MPNARGLHRKSRPHFLARKGGLDYFNWLVRLTYDCSNLIFWMAVNLTP